MERDFYYSEIKYVRNYACKAAGLDPDIAGWKTAVDALVRQLADAQRALDAERERVAFLDKKNVALVEASNLVLNVKAEQDAQLATLQAQVKQLGRTLADVYQQRDGLQAQLRQVEGELAAMKGATNASS